MAAAPFTRYIVFGPSAYWWGAFATSFLESKGWTVIETSEFIYEESYGYVPVHQSKSRAMDLEYRLSNSSAVIEYRGTDPQISVFVPDGISTLIDDLVAFISIYAGVYCQILWRESRNSSDEHTTLLWNRISWKGHDDEWAGGHRKAVEDFQKVLQIVPQIDSERLSLALRWFFSSLREYEAGRPLVEAALNWVCLESQATLIGIRGHKRQIVEQLIDNQGFADIPKLSNFYRLRNDAFHDGMLSNLQPADADLARNTGRFLVRAYILNLIGIPHGDFRTEFSNNYLS